ncbi:unnamed protein product [Linum tenue]|uniref:Late embryogenesis abundant protein LEA-2 subgroup domain-containing protein n=1 Tax=Linum tenue TaxID=586396 RepID=A0AAV0PA64_9ROSI|nr:unnamed protein product [Linum tenue]
MGLIALICWLSLRPSRPEFHIHHFTIVGLGQADGFESTRIVFNVSVRNPNRRLRISYESLSASVYYGGERIGSTPSLYSFDQPPENTSYVHHVLTGGVMAGNYGQPWMEIVSDRAQGMVDFRLELRSTIRYEKAILDLKRHRLRPKCNAPVGPDGLLLPDYRDKRCSL